GDFWASPDYHQICLRLPSSSAIVSGVGDSVTIPCLYPKTPANRHDRKFWCKMSATKVCNTIISTNSYTSDEYKNRAEITDFPHNSTAMLRMTSLRKNDSGIYRCGIGVTNRGLFISVNLTVLDGTVAGCLQSQLIAKYVD
uniref:Ig-like domain-containing protein n=1 Tax=Crocodylus porosus TaxID=8502 RepID=A0A7M4DVD7_CROPO